MPQHAKWQFWIDRGGTFTDVVARSPTGELVVHKLLSENPRRYRDAAIQAIRDILAVPSDTPIPLAQIEAVKMGTTVATNALLQRQGERIALAITRGFADALRIAYQNRPKLFARKIELPSMLYETVVEIVERIGARGEVVQAVDLDQAETDLRAVFANGIRSIAIVLMHGYRFSQHEERIAGLATKIGFTQISVSHQVMPLMKIVSRGDTTVVDAYLSPILRRYVAEVEGALDPSTFETIIGSNDGSASDRRDGRLLLQFMQSNGGLTEAHRFKGKDAVLSGPAGGVVGAVQVCKLAGFEKIIGFDMGGTSTDVTHYAGDYERAFLTEVAGVRLTAPMLKIHTVAAGGGSICSFDGARLRVGPASAGANPGPACYGRGGPLTVTDCNVVAGKLHSDFFQPIFGPNGDEPLDIRAAEEKLRSLSDEVSSASGVRHSPQELATGLLRIAVDNMANAIKQISIQRGYDVTEYALCCFGGAAGQHACLVADALGMRTILIHPLAGVLSAYGIGLADIAVHKQKAVEALFSAETLAEIEPEHRALEKAARKEIVEQGVAPDRIIVHRALRMKYEGTDSALEIAALDSGNVRQRIEGLTATFERFYRERYGFLLPHRQLVIEAMTVEAVGRTQTLDEVLAPLRTDGTCQPVFTTPLYRQGTYHDTPVYDRDALFAGDSITGPAIMKEANATTVIELGWKAEVTELNHLILTRIEPLAREHALGTQADPILLEVFNNLFMSIAEQMGVALAQTASSVNIKERLDFSCALFDSEGNLIANAPHMPVHLGSMGESVQTVIERRSGSMEPGDVYVLNAPYAGGTHLPDVTVIMPVFLSASSADEEESKPAPAFYVAARGHHADIGGLTPGSMPPNSKTVEEEGVVLDNVQLVARGHFLEEEIRAKLTSGPYPVRNIEQNLADLRAQVAACARGASELRKMVAHFGLSVVQAYMRHVQDNAEESVRRVLDVLIDGDFSYEMDNGSRIEVKIRIDKAKREAIIDFSGTSAQQANNFNAPSAVCKAAVLYVFRTLVDDDIPMNAGCLKPLTIRIPADSMLAPRYPAAVVAGNVETSQCITDCLYGALGVLAASQGTMNNFTFGGERYQYYETIAGGSGAGPNFDGCDAVQTHMTNSRLTDAEVLEWRFPVRLEEFKIRRGSGGHGTHRGGDGVERRIRFLEPMTAVILANHRRVAPFGVAGGHSGAVGRNWVSRTSGEREEFGATHELRVQAGDEIVIQTPGGGGYGSTC